MSAPRRSERRAAGRYFIRDNFLRFWYRFVLPNRSLLEIGEAEHAWRERIEPHLEEHLSLVFEDVCRDYVRRHPREKLPVVPDGEFGPHWHRDAEIEVVCRNLDDSVYCGECKWSVQPVGTGDLHKLEQKAQTLPPNWRKELRYVLFSRSGFTPDLRALEDGERIVLVDMDDLYGTAAPSRPAR